MNLPLKSYQGRVLDSLGEYLRDVARTGDPANPFQRITAALGQPAPYVSAANLGLPHGLPYVCLRVPTGGGKTLLGAHTVGIVQRDYLQAERCVVLWLVPSNPILDQTLGALADPAHPYRRALDVAVGGPVEVLSVSEALAMKRAVPDGHTVVIVATIQSFRVEDTTGRKVFERNGDLDDHFTGLTPSQEIGLELDKDGRPTHSLVNVLKLRRPVVIVDEAHNARTDLSFQTLAKFSPSCIIEFTATPDRKKHPSNVLHRVSAAELKSEAMIKLPIRVVTRPPDQWAPLVAEAVSLRSSLERLAAKEGQETGEHLRPILLFQARDVDHTKELREHLRGDLGLPADEIKICTSKLDELKDVKDISAPTCPVRFIITVQKLREGWDCPFAYVLCSLQNSAAATAIEQIVGRVLRLPSASFKRNAPLNEAYVFSVSPALPPVLAELRGALEMNGFTPAEADKIILPAGGDLTLAEQPQTFHVDPANDFNPEQLAEHSPVLLGKVAIDASAGRITVLKPINEQDERALLGCLRTEPAREAARDAVRKIRETAAAFQIQAAPVAPKSPFDQGTPFRVPVLGLMEGDLFERFEDTHLLEHEWDLAEKDAALTEAEFPSKRQTGEIGRVDVKAGGGVETSKTQETPGDGAASSDFVASLHRQVWSFAETSEWPEDKLIQWIDAKIFQSASERREIPAEQSALFIRKVLSGLKASRGMDAADLVLNRHRLVAAIESKIRRHREQERATAWQGFLLDDSPLVAPESHAIDFSAIHYDPSWNYDGAFKFQKHYFAPGPGELKSSGEEYQCACFLDGLAEIKTWVRNLSRRPTAFSLQIPKQRFYPDFVCLLHDGRVLVVEYKGKPWYEIEQSAEKRAVGAVWESRSHGKGLFIMPNGPDLQAIRSKIQT